MSAPARKALFALGQLLATPGVMEATTGDQRLECLKRHVRGDFGTICRDDAALNRDAIKNGDRILSAYPIDPAKPAKGYGENCFWIITEADRSVTTFLLPSEY